MDRPGEDPNAQIEVFYDAACPICTRASEMLHRLDRRGRLRLTPLQAAEGLPISKSELMERLHVRFIKDGRIASGAGAVAAACARIPVLWPLAAIVWAAVRTGWGEPLYRFIANRRMAFPLPLRSCSTACRKPDATKGILATPEDAENPFPHSRQGDPAQFGPRARPDPTAPAD